MNGILHYNKTKIIATIGPATESKEMLRALLMEGVDVCRINFSHGSFEQHENVIRNIHELNDELNLNTSILGDLQGPKLRIGRVENDEIEIETGKTILCTNKECIGTNEKIYIKYERLTEDLNPGERILIDDGKIHLIVDRVVDKNTISARIDHGGKVLSKKGFNLPDTDLTVTTLTDKDIEDLDFAIKHDVDWIGLSFVRRATDVDLVRSLIRKEEGYQKIIAKIEKPQAVENIDEIIAAADGIMVARGDLGVELPMERVPVIQKQIVEKCLANSKPVIIATQMMESMISSPTPTRAETNDVANAVMDGADAVMLSAETSIGKFPLKAVQAVEKILESTEREWDIYHKGKKPNKNSPSFLSDEICFTAVRISDHIKAKAIISLTYSGYTAFKIAAFRPNCHIFIFTANKGLFRLLSLVWNIRVFYYDKMQSTDRTIKDILNILKENGLLNKDDLVVHTASMPIQEKMRTNTLKISKVE